MYITVNKRRNFIMLVCVVAALILVGGCTDEDKRTVAMISGAIRSGLEQGRPQEMEKYNPDDFFTDPKVIELCHAIDNEDLALIDKLIAEGANVNAKGSGNMTLLLWAYPVSNSNIFAKILEAGADPNVRFERTFGSGTGLDPRPTKPDNNIVHTVAIGFGLPGKLAYVPELGKKLQFLIDAGADLDQVGPDRSTPLMKAVQSCNYDRAIMLVESGADWEMPIRGSVPTVLHILLEHDIPAVEGATPNAKLFGNEGYASYLKLIEVLEEKGADFDKVRAYREFYKKESVRLFGRPKEEREKIARQIQEEYKRYSQEKQQGVNE